MKKLLAALLLVAAPVPAQEQAPAASPIDDAVLAALRERGIEPAQPCSDETFVRRVYLDVIGTLPEPQEVRAFLADRSADKRARLIDALLERKEFADYWSMKWCDLLRVKSEFPINLWPNAVQAYHRWVHDAIRENRPYDRFAREMLTSSGSNFRVPAVNFYRAVQGRKPADLAGAAALTFMGARIEAMPKDRAAAMAVFFSRVAYKGTSEWKEEIVYLNPAPAENVKTLFPDGTEAVLRAEDDPRKVFADWLIRAENPWFARNVVNRIWAWLLGRGIIHEPDDIRPDNPPAIPAVLTILEKELVAARWDLRHVYRLILNSRTYQRSSGKDAEAEKFFAQYAVRQLDAEVLIDALCAVTGTKESYSSPIPEPFTFIPDDQRTILLADGSITSPFLEMFGRPARDTGLFSERKNQPTEAQRMYLLNSSHIQKKIENGKRLRELAQASKGDGRAFVRSLYLLILSRDPTKEETNAALQYAQTKGLGRKQAADDLAWALINSKEFLYRH
ncbi:MAG: DUF1553 domain-containing protein [Planctomycetes bacterium]|nr:DUF1553 domain-containing protein [Planctomycetota bacterium]